jgi:hypothetical protein
VGARQQTGASGFEEGNHCGRLCRQNRLTQRY